MERSVLMSRVRQKNTAPELIARSVLHRLGFRFTVNGPKNRTLPGRPDIVLPARRTVVFVHGCFWHRHAGCAKATTPATNRAYWLPKFADNVRRDKRQRARLIRLGWQVVTIWECETKNKTLLGSRLGKLLAGDRSRSKTSRR